MQKNTFKFGRVALLPENCKKSVLYISKLFFFQIYKLLVLSGFLENQNFSPKVFKKYREVKFCFIYVAKWVTFEKNRAHLSNYSKFSRKNLFFVIKK